MLKNLRKLFGVEGPPQEEPQAPLPPRRFGVPNHTTHSTIGQTIVVTIVERELNGVVAAEVNHEIKHLYADHPGMRHLLLDMENIKYVDSAGLNALVDLLAMVKRRHGRVALASATQHVEVLFKLTRLELVFSIRRSVIEAIDALEPKG